MQQPQLCPVVHPYLLHGAAPARQKSSRGVFQYLLMAAVVVGAYMLGHHHGQTAAETTTPRVTSKFMSSASRPARPRVAPVRAEAEDAPKPKAPAAPPPAAYDITKQPGVLPPTGFWDPWGLSKDKSEARLRYFQEAEIKHGRVSMLAALGFLVGESFHPLFGGNIDVPSYIAFQASPLQSFWPVVLAVVGVAEQRAVDTFTNPDGESLWKLKNDHQPGDLGWDPANLKAKYGKTPEEFRLTQAREIQNGRLAMLGIAGMVAQELVDGQPILGGPASAKEIYDIAQEMASVMNA